MESKISEANSYKIVFGLQEVSLMVIPSHFLYKYNVIKKVKCRIFKIKIYEPERIYFATKAQKHHPPAGRPPK